MLAFASIAPLNRPGKTKTLLIWFGYSLDLVLTINAPASLPKKRREAIEVAIIGSLLF